MNPLNPKHLDKLATSIEFCRRWLEPARVHRLERLRSLVGAHYSWSGSSERQPLNMIYLARNIYLRLLVPGMPRAMAYSPDPNLAPLAQDWTAWSDKAFQGMKLRDSLCTVVADALDAIGVMKVGECSAGTIDINGVSHFVGQPFAEPVDLDDLGYAIYAKRWEQCDHIENRYRVVLEEAKDNPFFDKTEREKLTAQSRFAYNEVGDPRVTTLSQNTIVAQDAEMQDYCELWDVWLPKEKLVITVPYQDSISGGFSVSKPLRIVEWQGPQQGPFLRLSYCDVSNNVMPAAPLQALQDMHELLNLLWRKLSRQGERQKSIVACMANTEDGERLERASDGDIIRLDRPQETVELNWGGMKPENIAAAVQSRELFNYLAGNIDSLGGQGPQTNTFHGDELIHQSASAQIAEMQDRTVNFTQEVAQSLGHWWWTNPILTYSAHRKVAGVDVPVKIPPQMRQIPFEDIDFRIDPYSMVHSTPQSKMQAIVQNLMQVIMPMMPQLAQQGAQINGQAILNLLATYGNTPEMKDVLKFGPPPQMQGAMQQAQQATQQARQAPVTTRNYVRTGRPGATMQGNGRALQQALSGGVQASQLNGVG